MSSTVALVGALDTKGEEYGFVADRLAQHRVDVVFVDTGVLGSPTLAATVTREAVARAGDGDLDRLRAESDRNVAMTVMGRGAARLVAARVAAGEIDGVMVLGGSNAGYVMSQVAAALPIGLPKVLVSTVVAGDTRPYVGASDLTMVYPIEDVAGLNSLSTGVLARAADACAGMVTAPPLPAFDAGRAVVGASMFGVTTGCVGAVQHALQAKGCEVHVFHATGVGGRSLESMIRSGLFAAVADLTTTELADDLCGGVCSAGPERLTAAAELGVPQVVSVGALDMVNFGAPDTVPERYAGRQLYAHNPAVTLMRTDRSENAELGRRLANKVNASTGPVQVHVPARGFSQISVAGAPFHDPDADRALVDALRDTLDDRVPLVVHDLAINDAAFAAAVADVVDGMIDNA